MLIVADGLKRRVQWAILVHRTAPHHAQSPAAAIVLATLAIASAVIAEASPSGLGQGQQPPLAS